MFRKEKIFINPKKLSVDVCKDIIETILEKKGKFNDNIAAHEH